MPSAKSTNVRRLCSVLAVTTTIVGCTAARVVQLKEGSVKAVHPAACYTNNTDTVVWAVPAPQMKAILKARIEQ